MKPKIVKSLFMSVISLLFLTLCMTIAWFYAIRENTVANGGFSIVNLEADLYFYNGNVSKDITDQSNVTKFGGYEDDMILDFTTSSSKHLLSEDGTKIDNTTSYFTKYVQGALTPSPFIMHDVKPGKRFLFLIKTAHNFDKNVTAKLNLTDWYSTFESDSKNHKIYLSEAIYFYSDTQIEVTGTAPLTSTNFDAVAATLASNLNTNLPANEVGYAKNKFKDANGKIKNEKNENVDENGKLIPIELGSFILTPKKTYLIPFILEFTDDPNSFYKYTTANGYEKDKIKGNSNVYEGLEISGIDIEFVKDF